MEFTKLIGSMGRTSNPHQWYGCDLKKGIDKSPLQRLFFLNSSSLAFPFGSLCDLHDLNVLYAIELDL